MQTLTTYYHASGGIAYFDFYITIYNMCTSESVVITSTFARTNSDPNFKQQLTLSEIVSGSSVISLPETGSNHNDIYVWQKNTDPGSLVISYDVNFPAHLTFSADSAYFFGNLDTWGITASYKKPK